MEIDLAQLPIPDWGLICPACRYPLRGLPEHRCPECGLRFDITTLIQPWTRLRDPRFTGNELPLPDFGLLCPGCGEPLAGAKEHACPSCGQPFDPQAWRPQRQWFLLDKPFYTPLPLLGVMSLLASEYVPYVPNHERSLAEMVLGQHVLMSALTVPSEFYFDIFWLLRQAREESEAARAGAGRGRWRCVQCGEQNPWNFELCWNCQESRDSAKAEDRAE